MLNRPETTAPYQLLGSRTPEMSNAWVDRPGRTPASWKSWTAYLKMPAATKISSTPLTVKNVDRLILIAPKYRSTPRTTALATPTPRPTSGADVVAPWAEAKNSSVVSRPSRTMARKAMPTTAPTPSPIAPSSRPSSSPDSRRAVRRIQKINQVTSPTATTEVIASKTPCYGP